MQPSKTLPLGEDEIMSQQLPKEQMVTMEVMEDLVVSHSYEMLALITVLEKKGILNRGEIIEVIKELRDKVIPAKEEI